MVSDPELNTYIFIPAGGACADADSTVHASTPALTNSDAIERFMTIPPRVAIGNRALPRHAAVPCASTHRARRVSAAAKTVSRASSALLHVRRRAGARVKILARRREDIDQLGVVRKPRLVLHVARNHADVAGRAHAPLRPHPEIHPPGEHPECLLVRMLVRRGVGTRLHGPPDDH